MKSRARVGGAGNRVRPSGRERPGRGCARYPLHRPRMCLQGSFALRLRVVGLPRDPPWPCRTRLRAADLRGPNRRARVPGAVVPELESLVALSWIVGDPDAWPGFDLAVHQRLESCGAGPRPGTCGESTPDSSRLLLKDPLHRRPGCASTPGGGLLHSPSARACQPSGLVPSLPFLPASTVCSAHSVQVCCALQPIMGFTWFQAALVSGTRRLNAEACSRRRESGRLHDRDPERSLESNRHRHYLRLSAGEPGRVRLHGHQGIESSLRRAGRRCQGWSKSLRVGPGPFRSKPSARTCGLRVCDVAAATRIRLGVTSRRIPVACRAIPTGASPFEAFPSRTARSESR